MNNMKVFLLLILLLTDIYPSSGISLLGQDIGVGGNNNTFIESKCVLDWNSYKCECHVERDYDTLPLFDGIDEIDSGHSVDSVSYTGTSDSHVEKVGADIFAELQLTIIKLSNFNVKQIEKGAFATNGTTLQDLYLHNLGLDVVNATFFYKANDLFLISLRGNHITAIRDFTFISLKRLKALHLEEPLQVIETLAFLGLSGIRFFFYNLNSKVEGLGESSLQSRVEDIKLIYTKVEYVELPLHKMFNELWVFKQEPLQTPSMGMLQMELVDSNLQLRLSTRITPRNVTFKEAVETLFIVNIPSKVLRSCMFSGFDSLQKLLLSQTSTEIIHDGAFIGLPRIEQIEFEYLGHGIRGLSYQTFSPVLKILKKLIFKFTSVQCGCKGAWLKHLIEIDVVRNKNNDLYCFEQINDNQSDYRPSQIDDDDTDGNQIDDSHKSDDNQMANQFKLHRFSNYPFVTEECSMEELFGRTSDRRPSCKNDGMNGYDDDDDFHTNDDIYKNDDNHENYKPEGIEMSQTNRGNVQSKSGSFNLLIGYIVSALLKIIWDYF